MIRRAIRQDIPAIVALGEEFTSTLASGHGYNREHTAKFIESALKSDSMVVFVMDHNGEIRGMAGAVIHPVFFNFDAKIATEMFWFVSEPHRKTFDSLRLFAALETWARDNGAAALHMIALGTNPGVSAIYERRKYTLLESTYAKRF